MTALHTGHINAAVKTRLTKTNSERTNSLNDEKRSHKHKADKHEVIFTPAFCWPHLALRTMDMHAQRKNSTRRSAHTVRDGSVAM